MSPCASPTSPRRGLSWRGGASCSRATSSTRASATWPSSPTARATRSCSTAATPRDAGGVQGAGAAPEAPGVIEVRRVDFVAEPVEDLRASEAWYAGTLRLSRNPNSSGERWVEFETGNLTLALSTFGGVLAFGVRDVEEARSSLADAGVEFAGDTFDSGVCHGASFADSFGNRLQLHHQYASLEPCEPPPADVQRTDFVNVPVTDRERGIDFYGGTLGLRRNELAHPEWPEFEAGNVTILLTTPEQTASEFRPSAYAVALRVPDVAAAMERLQGEDVTFSSPDVYDSSVCHMGFFADPDGNAFILHHRYTPYADGSTP